MNLERLSEPLDASRVKTREGSGGRTLSYLETHDMIRAANDIFGFGGWGHEVVELRLIDAVTVHNRDQKPGVKVGYLCVVKLTVFPPVAYDTGFVPTSGVGFGDAVEYSEGAAVSAHELAAKEAESDALKRALKNWGDQFGLALYSKSAASDGHLSSTNNVPEALKATEEEIQAYRTEVEAAGFAWEPALNALTADSGGSAIFIDVLQKHEQQLEKTRVRA